MRTLIERVTCDRCGQLYDFEKFSEASHTARIESLTEWLTELGWTMGDGVKRGDFCPPCGVERRHRRTGKGGV